MGILYCIDILSLLLGTEGLVTVAPGLGMGSALYKTYFQAIFKPATPFDFIRPCPLNLTWIPHILLTIVK